ncbi:hypothetical protein [Alistipes sp.]|uniref:hypothetical protein n=1 Tax=Alistipes sp. TaxID=1872444 RepID=UPI003AF0CB38
MKHLSLHTVSSAILLAVVSLLVITIYARNPRADRPIRLARRTAACARQDSPRDLEIRAAADGTGRVFEAQSRLDGSGSPMDPRLCTTGDGRVSVCARGQRAAGRLICRKTAPGGEIVFRFRCDPPLDTECTLILYSDSAIFSIGRERYAGKVVPMGDS